MSIPILAGSSSSYDGIVLSLSVAALVAIVPLGFGATIAIVNPTSFAFAGLASMG